MAKAWSMPDEMRPGGRYWAALPVYMTRSHLEKLFAVDIMDEREGLVDVVGMVHDKDKLEYHRSAGVLFRYFDSHEQRLEEFQQRINRAREKADERRQGGKW